MLVARFVAMRGGAGGSAADAANDASDSDDDDDASAAGGGGDDGLVRCPTCRMAVEIDEDGYCVECQTRVRRAARHFGEETRAESDWEWSDEEDE